MAQTVEMTCAQCHQPVVCTCNGKWLCVGSIIPPCLEETYGPTSYPIGFVDTKTPPDEVDQKRIKHLCSEECARAYNTPIKTAQLSHGCAQQ